MQAADKVVIGCSSGSNTDLKGVVIASTVDPDKNLLDAGTLTYSNIENGASIEAVAT
jgi:hypothetical protein